MNQCRKNYDDNSEDICEVCEKDNYIDDTDDDNESFIYEKCWCCNEEMTDINDIWIDDNDRYCHWECGMYYELEIKRCREFY